MPESTVASILSQVNNLSPQEREVVIAALRGDRADPIPPPRSAYGKYAGLLTPVDEFLRIKHEETAGDDSGSAK